ncbi:disease resistance protein RPP2B-like isoform X2 [Pistacia vera]|uniref:disease resistance protein RPP2B-like isoform X2 n=1 Tax=Pistacia vera TaxID=55513 RepID=UPI0012637AA7|nr:disease resistance protein RPP2B-like isoform X2 [Pistacia vera]
MASSSSSSRVDQKFHVFLSFRGEDTRENFTSHLYTALCKKKINTFIDSHDLQRGDEISQALLNAIEESKIAVIIFSKGYATSRWCLEELAKIIDIKKAGDLVILPVFYHVDPSDIRNQKESFAEAIVRHEKTQSLEKVIRWRNALTKTSNLSGFDSSNIRPESALIEEIVENIVKKLNQMSLSDNKDLVGVKSKIEEIELLLRLELQDVSSNVGIWGMGCIGKTTLARAIFNKISSQFDIAHFQDDVREECKKKNGLTHLIQQVLFAILDDKHANIDSIFTKSRLHSMKILIVFDDVTCSEQIEKFTGDCFGFGSRIIITSRDKHVLKTCGVNQDSIYEVEELSDDEALELFCRHAFKQNQPTAGYMELSKLALTFAKGIPLALKTLGGLLFDKTNSEWEDALSKIERISNPKIQDVLKISYDGLDDEEKKIFLDIACFFNGDDKNFVMKILDDNGFAAKSGVNDLIDKSLITIRRVNWRMHDYRIIIIHDLLQEMGRKIVSKESKDVSKRSRLWRCEDIYRVLKTNMGTGAIECIRLEMSKAKPFKLHPHAFSNMHNLRFLDFYCDIGCSCNFYNSHCKGGYICKEGQIDNKECNKLKHINLSNSKLLTRITDLSMIPNIESMILEGCTSLIEISSSEKYLNKLAIINLRGCISLESFPSTSCLNSLQILDLSVCQIPKSLDNFSQLSILRKLYLSGNNFEFIPPSNKEFSTLVELDVSHCQRLRSLPKLPGLSMLNAENCTSLEALHIPLLRRTKINLANCSKLDSNALKADVENALKLHVKRQKYSGESSAFYSGCFPGNEIPNWYSFQNMGSSITLELLPDLVNYKSILFDLCIVVKCRIRHPEISPPICCLVKMNRCQFGMRKDCDFDGPGPWHKVGDRYPTLDHVFMGSGRILKDYNWIGAGNDSLALDFKCFCLYTKCYCCEVIKCGVNLFYEKAEKEEST